jgi:hypothetical protein
MDKDLSGEASIDGGISARNNTKRGNPALRIASYGACVINGVIVIY